MRLLILVSVLLAMLAGSAFAQQGWRLETANAQWAERGHHGSVVFDDKLWVLGGRAGAQGWRDDSWASADGVNWDLKTTSVWVDNAVVMEFQGELWVVGGADSSEVWRSPDGVNWTQEPDAPWLGRSYAAGVVFNGRMWIFGGSSYPPLQRFNDVWSTTDGVNWTQEVAAAAWSPRAGIQSVVFNNRMWVIGGPDAAQLTNDVWSSADGVNWVQETANAGWDGRYSFQSVVYRDRIWVIGGSHSTQTSSGYFDDVWSSADGVNWVKETDGAPWGERAEHAATVFNGRIWLTGGVTLSDPYFNDVWSYGLYVTPDELPNAVAGEPYSADFKAHEGDGPFSWSLVSGHLPPGLTLNTSTTSDTLTLEGTPETQQITYTFTIRLEDKDGNTIEQEYTITVTSPRPPSANGGSAVGGCTARSTSSGQARATGSGLAGLTAGPSGMPWLILAGAVTLTAAILRRRDGSSASC